MALLGLTKVPRLSGLLSTGKAKLPGAISDDRCVRARKTAIVFALFFDVDLHVALI